MGTMYQPAESLKEKKIMLMISSAFFLPEGDLIERKADNDEALKSSTHGHQN